MKNKNCYFLQAVLFTLLLAGCSDNKQSKTETKENSPQSDHKTEKVSVNNDELHPPDFADPVLKQYYDAYTAYLKKIVAAIRDKDEPRTIKLFNVEGKQFKDLNEMEQKARSADEQVWTAWFKNAYPYQAEIAQSDYLKKFNEEYYKKVKEDFKEKEY